MKLRLLLPLLRRSERIRSPRPLSQRLPLIRRQKSLLMLLLQPLLRPKLEELLPRRKLLRKPLTSRLLLTK